MLKAETIDAVSSAETLTKTFQERLPSDTVPDGSPQKRRTAIFAIHGISPQQRYAFQDAVAVSVESYLNAAERRNTGGTIPAGRQWKTVVHWPKLPVNANAEAARPSSLRVYQGGDPDVSAQVYDVYEGYWSPLSKGKTTPVSVLTWLLQATLSPANSTAAVPASGKKIAWDLGYVFSILLVALLAVIGAGIAGYNAWKGFIVATGCQHCHTVTDFVASPVASVTWLPTDAYALLGLCVVFGYFLNQLFALIRAWFKRHGRTSELKQDVTLAEGEPEQNSTFILGTTRVARFQAWMFWIVVVLLLITGIVAYRLAVSIAPTMTPYLIERAALVVLAVAFLRFARFAADWAVENVLGDLQIYTTHDENSTFFGIRQAIIATVTDALLNVLRTRDGEDEQKPYYDAIHIFGHSLGSTVGMDALIQLAKMAKENAVLRTQWNRIKSFTTFGTSLEKTKYFFDVRQPTVSAAQDQWENDVYGALFTCDSKAWNASKNGIYWINLWYFHDVVANEIVSYESDVKTGAKSFVWNPVGKARLICWTSELKHPRPLWAWVHSDYLADPLFWERVGPMVTELRAP